MNNAGINKPVSILFVCMGNICRSPTAEAVFRAMKAYLVGHDPVRLEEMRFLIANPTASLYNNRTQVLAALEFGYYAPYLWRRICGTTFSSPLAKWGRWPIRSRTQSG